MVSQDGNSAAELTSVDQDDVVRQKIAKRHTLRLFKRSCDRFFFQRLVKWNVILGQVRKNRINDHFPILKYWRSTRASPRSHLGQYRQCTVRQRMSGSRGLSMKLTMRSWFDSRCTLFCTTCQGDFLKKKTFKWMIRWVEIYLLFGETKAGIYR